MAISKFRKLPVLKGSVNERLRSIEKHVGVYANSVALEAALNNDLFYGERDRMLSRIAMVGHQEAMTFSDHMANLNSPWLTSGTLVVGGGRAYGNSGATINVAMRPIEYGDRFRIEVPADFKDGSAGGRFSGVFVTTNTPAELAANNLSGTVAISFDQNTSTRRLFGTAFGITNPDPDENIWLDLSAGNQQFTLGFSMDPVLGLTIYARNEAGTIEEAGYLQPAYMAPESGGIGFKNGRPTHFGFFSTDSRGTSGTGYGPFSFRSSLAKASPVTGLQDAPHTQYGSPTDIAANPERVRVVTPKLWTGLDPTPAVIIAHGGGQDVWHARDLGEYFVDNGYIVASGDFRGYAASMYPFGSPPSIDRVYDLYRYLIEQYNIGDIFLAGYSMGGQTCIQTVLDGRIPDISGMAIGNPSIDIDHAWRIRAGIGSPYWAQVKAGWNVVGDTYEEWNAATGAYQPLTRPVEDFRERPMMIISSPDDTTALEEEHTLPFIDHLGVGYPVTHVAATGEHSDPSGWPFATILSFFGDNRRWS